MQLTLSLPEQTTAPAIPAAPALVPGWFDAARYEASLNDNGSVLEFAENPMLWTAKDLTFAIFSALDAALPEGAAVVINSSTGKDSTLMTMLFLDWLSQQTQPRRTAIYISDTGSEFPAMAQRMQSEASAINAWAQSAGLPVTAEIVRPLPKQRLLVELIGNGKPLPKISNASGPKAPASWCMDRVKSTPLAKAADLAAKTFGNYAQLIGVRTAESSRRAGNMAQHAEGLPMGLTVLGNDTARVGVTPIAHWSNEMLTEALAEWGQPWRTGGIEELKNIYAAGSDPSASPNECPIRVTKDGGITTTCSDLAGTRYGCWMCLLSKNKSLLNTAAKDRRYAWLKKAHNWIYRLHQSNLDRAILRDEAGFDADTLFPRTFHFQTRYFLLMLIMRAELESGFVLLAAEDLAMIETMWRRHGVHTVSTADARLDAANWRANGRPEFSWRAHSADQNAMGQALSEGIPSGAFFHLEQKAKNASKDEPSQALELAHLLALAGENFTTPISPTVMSYVFTDRLNKNRVIVLVTDTPSILGSRMNTGLINGLHGASWQLAGIRPLTAWEHRVSVGEPYTSEDPHQPIRSLAFSGGRSFYYASTWQEEQDRTVDVEATNAARFDAAVRLAENRVILSRGCPEEPLADWHRSVSEISDLRGQLTRDELLALARLVGSVVFVSDELTDRTHAAARFVRSQVLALVPDTSIEGPAGAQARTAIRKTAVAAVDLQSLLPLMLEWRGLVLRLAGQIRAGKANAALVARLAFLARLAAVDPSEADREVAELAELLGVVF